MSTTLRRRRRIVAVLLVLAGLIVLVIGGSMGWVHLGAGGKTFIAASVPEEPVAIVFGAGLSPDGSPSAFLGYRLDVAADLYHRGKVAVILVSGDNRTVDHDEPNAMRDYLIELGVPSDRIVRDYAGRGTYDTCVRAKEIFSVPSAVLVTQEYHLSRALAVCNAIGLESVGVADVQAGELFPDLEREYSIREIGANIKAVWDVLTNREPILGQKESSVTDALNRSQDLSGPVVVVSHINHDEHPLCAIRPTFPSARERHLSARQVEHRLWWRGLDHRESTWPGGLALAFEGRRPTAEGSVARPGASTPSV
jgi:vancomycin permeability regulator SanA